MIFLSKNIAWFNEISNKEVTKVGGKGASLGEMYGAGFPVPPGFIITAGAYENFLRETSIDNEIYKRLRNLDVENNLALQEASRKIKELIIEQEVSDKLKTEIMEAYESLGMDKSIIINPKMGALEMLKTKNFPLVAVRSSATAEDSPETSFAGQQETFLNVKGNKNLVEAVKKCWASLFTARSIYYRVKNNLKHEEVLVAVVIQKMVNSKKAGIIFSVNPTSNNESEILIEAGYGLGEAVVSGSITPDQYIVDKKDLKIKEKRINEQEWLIELDHNKMENIQKSVEKEKRNIQKLTDYEILKLAELAKKIEQHYKHPQDIEYAIENNIIYIVQSRPITTLNKSFKMEKEDNLYSGLKILVKGINASPGIGVGMVKIVESAADLNKIRKGDILVAQKTNPDYTSAMEKAAAIVTNAGGSASHAAIVSREMGTPCVVGTKNATDVLKEGQIITVDATNGIVYEGEVSIEKEVQNEENDFEVETIIKVKVNVNLPDYAEKIAKTGADGVGLLRAEHMILRQKTHPAYMIKTGRKNEFVNYIKENLIKVARAFKDKPVWYRTMDLKTAEFRDLEGGEHEPKEENPMLGWRGIRRDLDEEVMLRAHFEAVKMVHEEGWKNVGVMLPLVTHIDEVKRSKKILEDVGLKPLKDIEFGVMIETPAAVQIIEELCREGINFASLGTNDLTQYTLAVDRDNEMVQKLFNEMHPAVLREIEHVIKTCKKYNVESSICGQAGSKEEMAEFLVKTGIESISANSDSVHKIRSLVSKIEKRLLLDVARKKSEG